MISFIYPVVVEEAAEVLEAHIITSLSESCQHLILIGTKLFKMLLIFNGVTLILSSR